MTAFGDKVILPGDPGWSLDSTDDRLDIQASAALGADAMVFSALFALYEPPSRFYRYDAGRWLCVEVDAVITDLVVLQQPQVPGEGLVVLGYHGEVWFVGNDGSRTERISTMDGTVWRGGVSRLRHTAGTFYALGIDGQCYRRQGTDWVPDDEGVRGFEPPFPRKRPVDVGEVTDVSDIATLPNGDQYLCGSVAIARPALFWRPGGTGRWRWLGYAVDDPAYDYLAPTSMTVDPPDTVWVATDNGVVVKGNAAGGFWIASEVARWTRKGGSAPEPLSPTFSNVVFYRGALYAGSNVGPFRLLPGGRWELAAPQIDKEGYPFASGWLAVGDDVLWAFGAEEVARYDGHRWEPVPIPNLYG